ncbi:hypothetical protein GCM10027596_24780 [Nocardioides korecus]
MPALGLTVLVLLAVPAAPASAHATLLFTTPTVDGAVPHSPGQIQLVFDQPVIPSPSGIQLTDDHGASMAVGMPKGNGQTLTARVLATLPVGEYTVHWQGLARDGDAMLGEFHFAVGSDSGLTVGAGATSATRGLRVTALLRWMLFAGLALGLGGLAGDVISRRHAELRPVSTTIRPWLLAGAVVGLLATLGLLVALAGDGSVLRGLGSADLGHVVTTVPGRVAAVEVLAFAVAAVLFVTRQRLLGGVVLSLVAVAEGFRAHPQAVVPGLGAVLTGVHLLAVAVWVGALVHVLRVGYAARRRGLRAAPIVAAYARLAVWLFLAVVVSGTVSAVLLIPGDSWVPTLFGTGYGLSLVVKLVMVAAVAALAVAARRSLRARPDRAQPRAAARFEAVGLVVVLGLSGLLTALAPPVRENGPLPFPPPPVGSTESLGARAGWIGIGTTLSEGQLVVRLTTPDLNKSVLKGSGAHYELVGDLAGPRGGESHDLSFRACGSGCFVAPAQWTRGSSTLTLKASSDRWQGGSTAIPISWPGRPALGRLRHIVTTMRRVPAFTLHEQVTSNTNQGAGRLNRLPMSGEDFLSRESYGSGSAPTVVLLEERAGETTLALAYPGEGTYVRLTVDRDGRILRETLSAANHLTSRTFVYPEGDDGEH